MDIATFFKELQEYLKTVPQKIAPAFTEAKKVVLNPNSIWTDIASRNQNVTTVYHNFIIPLVLVSALAAFIGSVFIGAKTQYLDRRQVDIVTGLVSFIFVIGMSLLQTFVQAIIIQKVAERYNKTVSTDTAFQLSAYASSASLLLGPLHIVPELGMLGFFGFIYGIYLLFQGSSGLIGIPEDKKVGFTAITIACFIATMIAIGLVMATLGLASGKVF